MPPYPPGRPRLAIIVVAAGQGVRAGDGLPKQYRQIGGKCLLAHTLDALRAGAPDARMVVVVHRDHAQMFHSAVGTRAVSVVTGAASRQASSRAGLESLAEDAPDIVLIHDAARPLVSAALVQRAVAAALVHGCAIPGTSVTDTVKIVNMEGCVVATPIRSALRAVQTPQAFGFAPILAAHRAAAAAGKDDLSDDAAVAEFADLPVHVFEGESGNFKITTADDFIRTEETMHKALNDIRTGQGYDVHAFGPGDHVWLGGVKIAHNQGLVGHSDADVLLHAITDSLLGAIADGDIGAHFPPSDPRWKGAASALFLKDAVARVAALGGLIGNIDATLVCELPKIGPHRVAIRTSIAAITGLDISRIAVKATTSEQLGFTGRKEGMAALALATVRLPGA